MPTPQIAEVWLRGPVPHIPMLLQPVAHALLQAREEVEFLISDFPENRLWEGPAGMASPGFHLQHLAGVIDRLFTYAQGEALSKDQLTALAMEKQQPDLSSKQLALRFFKQVDLALDQLKQTDEKTLPEPRSVGRAQLPSNVLGLFVHAAEHTMRHVGQLLVTVNVLRHNEKKA
ncbi:MAG: DinB family protein [Chitinophagaceae bacterium]